MKLANIKANNQEYKGFILIENMSDLFLHYSEVTMGLTKETAMDIVNRAMNKDNGKEVHPITRITELVTKGNGRGAIYNQAVLMAGYYGNLEDCILDGYKIAINPFNKVSYFTITNGDTVEIIDGKVIYTKEDIKITRFNGGVHYYAKVGLIDVVDDYGNCKWNTVKRAQEVSEKFLKQYNEK